jgi:hypothetical protein
MTDRLFLANALADGKIDSELRSEMRCWNSGS